MVVATAESHADEATTPAYESPPTSATSSVADPIVVAPTIASATYAPSATFHSVAMATFNPSAPATETQSVPVAPSIASPLSSNVA